MAMYSSRPPFNDDPFPFVGPTGSRHQYPGTLDGVRLAHDPHPHFDRPQNNPTNRYLDLYRDDAAHTGWGERSPIEWLNEIESDEIHLDATLFTSEEWDHARRVLTRLARFQEES